MKQYISNIIQIAKTAHAIHRAYCLENKLKTQPNWDGISNEHRDTILSSVSKILDGEVTNYEQSHQNFIDLKLADGWVFSEEYSIDNKTSPRLIDFKYLNHHDRMKEILFYECVKSFSQVTNNKK